MSIWRFFRVCLRLVGGLAGAVATVAVGVLLYRQNEGRAAGLVGGVLVASLLVWWFLTRDIPARAQRRAGKVAAVIGWVGSGLLLGGGAFYYVALHPWEPKIDGWLAMVGAALVGTELLRRGIRRSADEPAPRRFLVALRWLAYVVLAGAAPILGVLISAAAFWVPVTVATQVHDWWPGWLAWPAAVLVWLVWIALFSWATGMHQSMYITRYRELHGFIDSFGRPVSYTGWSDWSSNEDHPDMPFRTGLTPLVRLSWRGPAWSNTSGGGSLSFSAVTVEQYWVRRLEFPPAYLPGWFRAFVEAAGRRRRDVPDADERRTLVR